jgi:hypothetical protein
MSGVGTLDSAGIWPEFGHGQSRLDLAKIAGIRPNGRDPVGYDWIQRSPPESVQTCSPESSNGDRTLPDSGKSCIFPIRNFFVRTKHRKIFSRKLFFLKMISSKNILRRKPFYVETNGT